MNRFFYIIVFAFILTNMPVAYSGEWLVHASKLKEKLATINQLETEIENNIEIKNTKKGAESAAALDTIVEKHKELKKALEEYNKIRSHIRFEHPEQGDSTERNYRNVRLKSLEEFEDAVGIYGKLDRIQRKLKKVYNMEKPKAKALAPKKKEKTDLDTEVPSVKLSVE
ncbi:MAG: hypothetical protein VX642_06220 [Bdellovibrionota bacterium]|nr:hypothetical protein [Bdellovibrionota bacterium]